VPLQSPLLDSTHILQGWETEGQFLVFPERAGSGGKPAAATEEPWGRPPPGNFGWEDAFGEMRVLVPVEAHTTAGDVRVCISAAHLAVAVRSGTADNPSATAGAPGDGRPLRSTHGPTAVGSAVGGSGAEGPGEEVCRVDVTLFGKVDPAASWWRLEDRVWYYGRQQRCLVVTLSKVIRSGWAALEPLDATGTDGWWGQPCHDSLDQVADQPRSDTWQTSYTEGPQAASPSPDHRASASGQAAALEEACLEAAGPSAAGGRGHGREAKEQEQEKEEGGQNADGGRAGARTAGAHKARGMSVSEEVEGPDVAAADDELEGAGADDDEEDDEQDCCDAGEGDARHADEGDARHADEGDARHADEGDARHADEDGAGLRRALPAATGLHQGGEQILAAGRASAAAAAPALVGMAGGLAGEERSRTGAAGWGEESDEGEGLSSVDVGNVEDLASPAVAAWLNKDDAYKSDESEAASPRDQCEGVGASEGARSGASQGGGAKRAGWPQTRAADGQTSWPHTSIDWDALELPARGTPSSPAHKADCGTEAGPSTAAFAAAAAAAEGGGAGGKQGGTDGGVSARRTGSADHKQATLQSQIDEDWEVGSKVVSRLVLAAV